MNAAHYARLVEDAVPDGDNDKDDKNASTSSSSSSSPAAPVAIVAAKLADIGFPPDQAAGMAAVLVAQPQAAAAFAQMPLTDLLELVPSGALTRDVFHIGHEPGWFFDKWQGVSLSHVRIYV